MQPSSERVSASCHQTGSWVRYGMSPDLSYARIVLFVVHDVNRVPHLVRFGQHFLHCWFQSTLLGHAAPRDELIASRSNDQPNT